MKDLVREIVGLGVFILSMAGWYLVILMAAY